MSRVRPMRAFWLGRRRYEPMHELQRAVRAARTDERIADTILLLEHDPVITLGSSADPENVLLDKARLATLGVDLVETGRGGDVTFHGPGQLVAYPIVDLKPDRCDVRAYVRALAETMIQIVREHGIEAGVVEGLIGAWVDKGAPHEWASAPWARELAKIGAIGVRISRWVTMHGFALNLSTDLRSFDMIIPCGIRDHGVTSVEALTGKHLEVRPVALAAPRAFSVALDASIEGVVDLEGASFDDIERAIGLG
jgi:lipoyl(octanoyl) transferase